MTAVADRAGSPGRPGTTRRRAARQGLQGRIHGRPWPTSFHPLRPGTRLRPRQWEGSRSRWTSRGGRNRCACAGGVRSWEIRSSRWSSSMRWRQWMEALGRGEGSGMGGAVAACGCGAEGAGFMDAEARGGGRARSWSSLSMAAAIRLRGRVGQGASDCVGRSAVDGWTR